MLEHAWLIPALPAIAFFVITFVGKRMPKHGAELGILATGTSFVLSCIAAAQWIDGDRVHPVVRSITWWRNGGVKFGVGTTVDGLTVMMMFVVCLISLLVQIYSTAYMHDDRRYTWFFACLS